MNLPSQFYYNDGKKCVEEMLFGISVAHPALCVNKESKIVLLNRDRKHHVGLISGGGSGHEPFCAGYVGEGMLQGAVVGNIFTSPSSLSISTAINNIARLNGGGVLIFVLNYTGDILNFGLAAEEARNKGLQVECVVINDDCAISGSEMHTIAGKRGICGAVFMFKIAGALSSAGRVLSEIAIESRAVGCRLSTLGLCLAPCSVPGTGPLFTMDDNEMLFGVGIHGEAGISSMQACSAPEAVKLLLTRIIKNLVIKPGDSVCVLVNNLGSTTLLEMYIIVAEVKRQLEVDYQITRLYVGTLMSSLDMRGIQVSVLNVTGRDEWIQYLDIETEAFGWPGTKLSRISDKYPDLPINLSIDQNIEILEVEGMEIGESESLIFQDCIKAICNALIENEQKLNQLDSIGGDGDCGSTFRHMSEGALKLLTKLPFKHVTSCFLMLSQLAKIEMGGTSGALYSIMLLGASKSTTDWKDAWKNAIDLLQKYSGAQLGHRTMLDALVPAYQAFESKLIELEGEPNGWMEALKESVAKAGEGCQNTINMIAKAGRASYVDPCKITDVDPGAFAVVVWLTAIMETLESLQNNRTGNWRSLQLELLKMPFDPRMAHRETNCSPSSDDEMTRQAATLTLNTQGPATGPAPTPTIPTQVSAAKFHLPNTPIAPPIFKQSEILKIKRELRECFKAVPDFTGNPHELPFFMRMVRELYLDVTAENLCTIELERAFCCNVLAKLKGDAGYIAYSYYDAPTFESIAETLQKTFGDKRDISLQMAGLRALIRYEGETVMSWGFRVRHALTSIHACVAESPSPIDLRNHRLLFAEEEAVMVFTTNLKGRASSDILTQGVRNLQTAINLAMKHDQVYEIIEEHRRGQAARHPESYAPPSPQWTQPAYPFVGPQHPQTHLLSGYHWPTQFFNQIYVPNHPPLVKPPEYLITDPRLIYMGVQSQPMFKPSAPPKQKKPVNSSNWYPVWAAQQHPNPVPPPFPCVHPGTQSAPMPDLSAMNLPQTRSYSDAAKGKGQGNPFSAPKERSKPVPTTIPTQPWDPKTAKPRPMPMEWEDVQLNTVQAAPAWGCGQSKRSRHRRKQRERHNKTCSSGGSSSTSSEATQSSRGKRDTNTCRWDKQKMD